MTDAISLSEFSVSINGRLIVGPISVSVPTGQAIAILGPSGVGKSVLLRGLAGLEPGISGSAIIEEKVVRFGHSDSFLLFQDYDALPWRTVEQNLLILEPRGEDVLKLLYRLGLSMAKDSYPSQLSGGMRKRLAIGRSLLARQSIIFIDEAFSSLDIRTRESVFRLVREELMPNRTILVITHDPYDAVSLAQRYWLLDGRPAQLVADTTSDQLGHSASVVEEGLRRLAESLK